MALLDPSGMLNQITWETRFKVHEMARKAPEFDLVVRSGRRTCAQQNNIYGQGRTHSLDQPVVTYARGCQSWHVSGRAVDLNLRHAGTQESAQTCTNYTKLGEIWEKLGGRWGGRFGGFGGCGDAGHFEWHPGLSVSDVCPDPGLCDGLSAEVDRMTVAPWHKRVPWLQMAAGGAVGLGLGLSVVMLATAPARRRRRARA